MGQDLSSHVALLADLLDASSPGAAPVAAIDALRAIGPRARAALPRLVRLTQRLAAACPTEDWLVRVVDAVDAIASPTADAAVAAQALAPLLACYVSRSTAARSLARYGSDGQAVLLRVLRDDDRTVDDRLVVAPALRSVPGLAAADREILRLLEAKAKFREARAWHEIPSQVPSPTPVQPRDPQVTVREEFEFCRAEAGAPWLVLPGLSNAQAAKLGDCLARYTCGPSRSTLARTLGRCCSPAFGNQLPAFCHP
jgi:hypothetical protein